MLLVMVSPILVNAHFVHLAPSALEPLLALNAHHPHLLVPNATLQQEFALNALLDMV